MSRKDLKKLSKLSKNKKWKNKYKGKRCFIIGNGPSINSQNLSVLANEYTFTVNQLMRSDIYNQVKPNFHVIYDPLYFNLDVNNKDHLRVIEVLKMINQNGNDPECFFPSYTKSKIDLFGLSSLKMNYFLDGLSTKKDGISFDLTKRICSYYTVVQYAITIAVHMGFDEIYLLGCDMTGYKEVEQFIRNDFSTQVHAYKETESDMKSALHSKRSCEDWFYSFYRMFADYKRLNKATQENNVKLVDLTKGGLIDCLEKQELFNVVNIVELKNQ